MTEVLAHGMDAPLPLITPAQTAFFFDLDGTLAEFCLNPQDVRIAPDSLNDLARLARDSGALAVVSGRPLAQIDRLVAPLAVPAAGIHGVERRDAAGHVHRLPDEALPPASLSERLQRALASLAGTFVEDKGAALALHYRGAPEHARAVLQIAQAAAVRHPQLRLQPGKFVVELKPAQADKGRAIAAFLNEAPFAGRRPLFIGDDRTDEAGFAVVNAAQGISIKVGPGETCAAYRLADVSAVSTWLHDLATPGTAAV